MVSLGSTPETVVDESIKAAFDARDVAKAHCPLLLDS